MRYFTLRKKNGQLRYIHACSNSSEKRFYRRMARVLAQWERRIAQANGVAHVAHGFVPGRSVVTALQPHVGAYCTLSVDLRNWYDSVTVHQARQAFATISASARWVDFVCRHAFISALDPQAPNAQELCPRQGLPTSPAAANLVAVLLDQRLDQWCQQQGFAYAYTRYADDLLLSFFTPMTRTDVQQVLRDVVALIQRFGWTAATEKTEVHWASSGRRPLLGLTVGSHDIRGNRQLRRRLRAALHQNNYKQIHGLKSWYYAHPPRSLSHRRETLRVALHMLQDAQNWDFLLLLLVDWLEQRGYPGLAYYVRHCRRKRALVWNLQRRLG